MSEALRRQGDLAGARGFAEAQVKARPNWVRQPIRREGFAQLARVRAVSA